MRSVWRLASLTTVFAFVSGAGALAAPGDFTTWTQVQDPADAHFTSSATASTATLNAGGGPVPGGTDIGYQSVSGATVATSTHGFYFDPAVSMSLAIDFTVAGSNQSGTLGVGFGIGEDGGGMNSAGAAMLIQNGTPLAYGAAARVNDVNQSAALLGLGSLSGSLFVSYDAGSGDIAVGESTTAGALTPDASHTYSGIEHLWDGDGLLASFFLRSDSSLGTPWQSGDETATFSNFRVLSGSATAVPEPASIAILGVGMPLIARRRRR